MDAHRGRGEGFEEDETGAVASTLAALQKKVAEMQAQLSAQQKEINDLRKSSPFTVSGNTVKLENKDLHIRTGNLKVDAASGNMKGNIVIGNNDVTNARHSFAAGYSNVLDGKAHFVVGTANTVLGTRANVFGGNSNTASGLDSVVVGGKNNVAS